MFDAARTALRLNANVKIVYRRGEKNMKCLPSEYEEAKEDGVEFQFYSAPRAVVGSGKAEGLTKVLGVEWGKLGIRVNAVSPGYVATNMNETDQVSGGYTDQDIFGRTPMQRYATAEEIANVVAFVASDEASYMTGENVNVDGGWVAYGGWNTYK